MNRLRFLTHLIASKSFVMFVNVCDVVIICDKNGLSCDPRSSFARSFATEKADVVCVFNKTGHERHPQTYHQYVLAVLYSTLGTILTQAFKVRFWHDELDAAALQRNETQQ